MTPEKLDELQRLADAATQGKRSVRINRDPEHGRDEITLKRAFWELGNSAEKGIGIIFGRDDSDADFIAALDPDTVRELIALARRGMPVVHRKCEQCDGNGCDFCNDSGRVPG